MPVVTPVIPSNPPPRQFTSGIAVDANGAIWRYQGAKGYAQIGNLGDLGNTITLAAATPVTTASVLTTGQWLFVATAGTPVSIIQSDGTTHAPATGNAYKCTVGA